MFHLSSPAFSTTAGSPLALLSSLPQYETGHLSHKELSLPGGGLTRRVLSSILESWTNDAGFLIWMGMEGDNRDDATLVASVIAKVLSADDKIKGH